MPLIGAADASLRGLRSPEGDEQKAFWSSPSRTATGGGNTNRNFRFAALFLLGKKRAGLFKPATFFIIEFILQNREVRGSLELQFALVLFLPLGYDARVENTAFFEIGT